MRLVAHIRYDGGALVLPARDPYDREIVFQQAESCARRHGRAGMQIGSTHILVQQAEPEARCEACGHPAWLVFTIERRSLCSRCIQQHLRGAAAPAPSRPAAGERATRRPAELLSKLRRHVGTV